MPAAESGAPLVSRPGTSSSQARVGKQRMAAQGRVLARGGLLHLPDVEGPGLSCWGPWGRKVLVLSSDQWVALCFLRCFARCLQWWCVVAARPAGCQRDAPSRWESSCWSTRCLQHRQVVLLTSQGPFGRVCSMAYREAPMKDHAASASRKTATCPHCASFLAAISSTLDVSAKFSGSLRLVLSVVHRARVVTSRLCSWS